MTFQPQISSKSKRLAQNFEPAFEWLTKPREQVEVSKSKRQSKSPEPGPTFVPSINTLSWALDE